MTCFAISKSIAVIILKSNNWEGGRVKEIQEVIKERNLNLTSSEKKPRNGKFENSMHYIDSTSFDDFRS